LSPSTIFEDPFWCSDVAESVVAGLDSTSFELGCGRLVGKKLGFGLEIPFCGRGLPRTIFLGGVDSFVAF
jgi:hypothetical protein